jgi:hypothetical protein
MSESVNYYSLFGLDNVSWNSINVALVMNGLRRFGISTNRLDRIIHSLSTEYKGKLEEFLESGELNSFLEGFSDGDTWKGNYQNPNMGGTLEEDEDCDMVGVTEFIDYDCCLTHNLVGQIMDNMGDDTFAFFAMQRYPGVHFSQLNGSAIGIVPGSPAPNKLSKLGSISAARKLWRSLYAHCDIIVGAIRRYAVETVCYKTDYEGIASFLKKKLDTPGKG